MEKEELQIISTLYKYLTSNGFITNYQDGFIISHDDTSFYCSQLNEYARKIELLREDDKPFDCVFYNIPEGDYAAIYMRDEESENKALAILNKEALSSGVVLSEVDMGTVWNH